MGSDEKIKEVQAYFTRLLSDEKAEKSTGLAAIETLMEWLKKSQATTVSELQADLEFAIQAMLKTNHSSASVQSASELFLRFISMVTKEQLTGDFDALMTIYKKRGENFIARVATSRSRISKFSRLFIQNNARILTHSYSRCVLQSLLDSKKAGRVFHVYVTESQPDVSGRQMYECLKTAGIPATLVLDGAVGYLMEKIDMIFLGAEGVMETGGIINKIGSLSMAMIAKAMNKPVYVMAESIKFVKEYPINQNDVPDRFKYRFSTLSDKRPLDQEHPINDYTPPQYINLLITDLGIFTPAAVGDELIKLYT